MKVKFGSGDSLPWQSWSPNQFVPITPLLWLNDDDDDDDAGDDDDDAVDDDDLNDDNDDDVDDTQSVCPNHFPALTLRHI